MKTKRQSCYWIVLSLLMSYCCSMAEAVGPPNIILIMADDLGYGDLGCYGQQLISTPNIDQLASEGVRFTQAYAGAPVCTPSRCALMTGRHVGHAAARDNIPHYATYLHDQDVTVAEVLSSVGYRCGGVGKWSLGDAETEGRATRQGFVDWLGYLNQDHAHFYYPEYLDDNDARMELTGNPQDRTHYSHDLMVERLEQFVRQSASAPFFYLAAFTLPHFASPDEDADGLTVPTTAPYDQRAWSQRAKKYAAMIHRLDRDVGRIVQLLEQLKLTEQTLIIFTSDNGGHDLVPEQFHTSGPLRGFKRDLYEGGIRVPFIARWPTIIPSNCVSDQVIAFQDILPTLAHLTGATVPPDIDGIDVGPALQGQTLSSPHPWLYWEYGHCRNRFDQAVRMGNWKGIRLGKESPITLYDLSSDLAESIDQSAAHPQIVQQISKIMLTASNENPRYPVGQLYTGKPRWKPQKAIP